MKYPEGTVLRGKGVPLKNECLQAALCGYPCNPEFFSYLYLCRGALVPVWKVSPMLTLPYSPLKGDARRIPPIVVALDRNGFRLIDGRHRLSALRRAGHKLVRAVIVEDKRKE